MGDDESLLKYLVITNFNRYIIIMAICLVLIVITLFKYFKAPNQKIYFYLIEILVLINIYLLILPFRFFATSNAVHFIITIVLLFYFAVRTSRIPFIRKEGKGSLVITFYIIFFLTCSILIYTQIKYASYFKGPILPEEVVLVNKERLVTPDELNACLEFTDVIACTDKAFLKHYSINSIELGITPEIKQKLENNEYTIVVQIDLGTSYSISQYEIHTVNDALTLSLNQEDLSASGLSTFDYQILYIYIIESSTNQKLKDILLDFKIILHYNK